LQNIKTSLKNVGNQKKKKKLLTMHSINEKNKINPHHTDISKNKLFYVPQKKESHTGLE